MDDKLIYRLRQIVDSAFTLQDAGKSLQVLRTEGYTRSDMSNALHNLRNEMPSDDAEDRVLELLDLVSGYCQPDLDIH